MFSRMCSCSWHGARGWRPPEADKAWRGATTMRVWVPQHLPVSLPVLCLLADGRVISGCIAEDLLQALSWSHLGCLQAINLASPPLPSHARPPPACAFCCLHSSLISVCCSPRLVPWPCDSSPGCGGDTLPLPSKLSGLKGILTILLERKKKYVCLKLHFGHQVAFSSSFCFFNNKCFIIQID